MLWEQKWRIYPAKVYLNYGLNAEEARQNINNLRIFGVIKLQRFLLFVMRQAIKSLKWQFLKICNLCTVYFKCFEIVHYFFLFEKLIIDIEILSKKKPDIMNDKQFRNTSIKSGHCCLLLEEVIQLYIYNWH